MTNYKKSDEKSPTRAVSPSSISTTSSNAPLVAQQQQQQQQQQARHLPVSATTTSHRALPTATSIAEAQLRYQEQLLANNAINRSNSALSGSTKSANGSKKLKTSNSGNSRVFKESKLVSSSSAKKAPSSANISEPAIASNLTSKQQQASAAKERMASEETATAASTTQKSLGYEFAKKLAYRVYSLNELNSINKMRYLNFAYLFLTVICLITVIAFSANHQSKMRQDTQLSSSLDSISAPSSNASASLLTSFINARTDNEMLESIKSQALVLGNDITTSGPTITVNSTAFRDSNLAMNVSNISTSVTADSQVDADKKSVSDSTTVAQQQKQSSTSIPSTADSYFNDDSGFGPDDQTGNPSIITSPTQASRFDKLPVAMIASSSGSLSPFSFNSGDSSEGERENDDSDSSGNEDNLSDILGFGMLQRQLYEHEVARRRFASRHKLLTPPFFSDVEQNDFTTAPGYERLISRHAASIFEPIVSQMMQDLTSRVVAQLERQQTVSSSNSNTKNETSTHVSISNTAASSNEPITTSTTGSPPSLTSITNRPIVRRNNSNTIIITGGRNRGDFIAGSRSFTTNGKQIAATNEDFNGNIGQQIGGPLSAFLHKILTPLMAASSQPSIHSSMTAQSLLMPDMQSEIQPATTLSMQTIEAPSPIISAHMTRPFLMRSLHNHHHHHHGHSHNHHFHPQNSYNSNSNDNINHQHFPELLADGTHLDTDQMTGADSPSLSSSSTMMQMPSPFQSFMPPAFPFSLSSASAFGMPMPDVVTRIFITGPMSTSSVNSKLGDSLGSKAVAAPVSSGHTPKDSQQPQQIVKATIETVPPPAVVAAQQRSQGSSINNNSSAPSLSKSTILQEPSLQDSTELQENEAQQEPSELAIAIANLGTESREVADANSNTENKSSSSSQPSDSKHAFFNHKISTSRRMFVEPTDSAADFEPIQMRVNDRSLNYPNQDDGSTNSESSAPGVFFVKSSFMNSAPRHVMQRSMLPEF